MLSKARMAGVTLGFAVALASAAFAQAPSQEQIDKAIDNGAKFLLEKYKNGFPQKDDAVEGLYAPLVIYTLIHAGVPEDHPVMQKAIEYMCTHPLSYTYNVGVTAMALRKLDAARFKIRIAECALFLVENPGTNGQWGYGQPVMQEPPVDPAKIPPPIVASGDKADDPTERKFGDRTKDKERDTREEKKIKIVPRKVFQGGKEGDNSNTQYAILGLRAACEAGCAIPKETWENTLRWFLSVQKPDGSFDYNGYGVDTGIAGYGSMTTAGAACIAMCCHFLGKEWRGKPPMEAAEKWLGDNLIYDGNPKHPDPKTWHYYYLYGMERVGQFLGGEKIANKEWYGEGAKWLIGQQKTDGSWDAGQGTHKRDHTITDTCFAILFLKRADSPLRVVESGK